MPNGLEQGARAEFFRPWWEAVKWIVDVRCCSPKEAFIQLCVAVSRGCPRAVDGRHTTLSRFLFPARLAHLTERDNLCYAERWWELEQQTLICWEDLLKLCPPKRPATSTVGEETLAIDFLAGQLKADPNLPRDHALKICRNQFPKLSERGFRFRVWPRARETVGLTRIASPGRKPNRKS